MEVGIAARTKPRYGHVHFVVRILIPKKDVEVEFPCLYPEDAMARRAKAKTVPISICTR